MRLQLSVPGIEAPNGRPFIMANQNIVTPGYFASMRIPLLAGRDFSPADRPGAQPVAIIGAGAAQRFWPGQDAVGKSLLVNSGGSDAMPTAVKTLLIVGVARDVKTSIQQTTARLFVYLPLQQNYSSRVTIVARTINGQRITGEIRKLVSLMNPHLPIVSARTLEEATALGVVPQRVAASVAGTLGIVGLLLAAIGIYGVTAYAVAGRTREIGIRIALGAQRSAVVGMVLWQGMSLAVIGCTIGLILAVAASRLLGTLLLGIPPLDPVTFGLAASLFTLVGLAACYVPARRATQIAPTDALRHE
jgi:predicted permease